MVEYKALNQGRAITLSGYLSKEDKKCANIRPTQFLSKFFSNYVGTYTRRGETECEKFVLFIT